MRESALRQLSRLAGNTGVELFKVLGCRCSAVSSRVVLDGNLVTSRGPGTAFEFALTLVKVLYGEEMAAQVAGPMVMYDQEVV